MKRYIFTLKGKNMATMRQGISNPAVEVEDEDAGDGGWNKMDFNDGGDGNNNNNNNSESKKEISGSN